MYFRMAISLLIFSFVLFSCGCDDVSEKGLNDFTGAYDCLKFLSIQMDSTFAVQQDLIVAIDPDNEDNLLINNLSIPVDADGAFGPSKLNSNMGIELYFDGDDIFFRMSPIIENGIAAPCIFRGSKI